MSYSFGNESYAKRDTEIVDTWLDAVILLDSNDDVNLLQADNDLFLKIYALNKLIPSEDVNNMKNYIKKLIQRTPVNVFMLGIMPCNCKSSYDKITIELIDISL